MRLQRYLTEKYMDTLKQSYRGIQSEVFINPSKKELQEVIADNMSMRFIIDFKHKKFYAFDVKMFHETVMNAVKELPNFRPAYWENGVGLDYIYTGATYRTEVDSDAMTRFEYEKEFYPKLFKLRAQNWSWVNKYVDSNKCIDTIEDIIGQQ